jgi:hypothetical protein
MRLDSLPSLSKSQIDSVQSITDLAQQDHALCKLGESFTSEFFTVINPEFDRTILDHLKNVVPTEKCLVWIYETKWAIKLFKKGWSPNIGYDYLYIPPLLRPRTLFKLPFTWERNKEIPPNVVFDYNPTTQYNYKVSDLRYTLTWFLDPTATKYSDSTWVYRCNSPSATATKNMGTMSPIVSPNLDIVFISYNEPNADDNWQRVLEKAPYAKRVDNVKGILEAHKAAATMSTTDMFYVVDGDAYLTDDWQFDFVPDVLDRSSVHIWYSKNPINDLEYGYGGVKLFPKDSFSNLDNTSPLDITLFVAKRVLVTTQVSNVTAFNTDAFSTWKSAVRECTKLCLKSDTESATRLTAWTTVGIDRPFGEYAIAGAMYARQLVEQGLNPTIVNDREWLRSEFNRIYNECI